MEQKPAAIHKIVYMRPHLTPTSLPTKVLHEEGEREEKGKKEQKKKEQNNRVWYFNDRTLSN